MMRSPSPRGLRGAARPSATAGAAAGRRRRRPPPPLPSMPPGPPRPRPPPIPTGSTPTTPRLPPPEPMPPFGPSMPPPARPGPRTPPAPPTSPPPTPLPRGPPTPTPPRRTPPVPPWDTGRAASAGRRPGRSPSAPRPGAGPTRDAGKADRPCRGWTPRPALAERGTGLVHQPAEAERRVESADGQPRRLIGARPRSPARLPSPRSIAIYLVDDLKDDAPRVAILQQRLGLEDIVSPLTRVYYVAVGQTNAEVENLTSDHVSSPSNHWNAEDREATVQ